jgi:DNA-binding NarL/FixJ family response regulator
MIRVIVADDHHLVRQGIRMLLEKAGDIEVVGEAEDGQEAVEMAERLTPDVLVMDISMPRLNGTQATERIHSRGLATQVVILSMHADETIVRQALRYGAKGYVLKRAVAEELLLAVRAANLGDTYLSPPIAGSILSEFLAASNGSDEPDVMERLIPRERQVLQLLAEGGGNRARIGDKCEDRGEAPDPLDGQTERPRSGRAGPRCGQTRPGFRRTIGSLSPSTPRHPRNGVIFSSKVG